MKYLFLLCCVSSIGCAVESTQEITAPYEVKEEKTYSKEIETGSTGTCPPRFKLVFEDESFKFYELPCSKDHNTNPISDEPGWIK